MTNSVEITQANTEDLPEIHKDLPEAEIHGIHPNAFNVAVLLLAHHYCSVRKFNNVTFTI